MTCRWAATLGVVLAISRAFIIDPGTTAFHPELAMLEVRSVPASGVRVAVRGVQVDPQHMPGARRGHQHCTRSAAGICPALHGPQPDAGTLCPVPS